MHAKAQAILEALGFFSASNGKPYCYPSQHTLLRVLRSHYGETMARSTLNVYLTRLQEGRYFDRVRRHKRGVEGNIIFRTTLYKLKFKAINFLYQLNKDLEYLLRYFRVRFPGQHRSKTPSSLFGAGFFGTLKSFVLPANRGHPTPLEVKNTSFKEKAPYLPQNYMNPEDYWRGKR